MITNYWIDFNKGVHNGVQIDLGEVSFFNEQTHLKALSVILNSKLYFFPNPQIFLHIQGEIHYNKLQVEQFPRKQHIFGKTDNFFIVGN